MRHWILSRNALKETEFVWDEHGIILNEKVLNNYDCFVLDFTLEKEKIRYVLLSGHIAILFGRSRQTEDIAWCTLRGSNKFSPTIEWFSLGTK